MTVEQAYAEFAQRCIDALNLCEEGLYTDGEWHKQWYLEEIAKVLLGGTGPAWEAWQHQAAGDEDDEETYAGEWDPGIAP